MNEKVKQAFEILKEFLRMTDDDENPTNAFYHEEELNIIETALKELKELKEFAKVLCKMKIVDSNHKIYGINEKDIELIKKVVEKYGKE